MSLRKISFRYCLRTINTLSDTDDAWGVIIVALCLRMYESPLHQRKLKRKTRTHTPTSHERYRFEEAKIIQFFFQLECPLHEEWLMMVTLQSLQQKLIVEKRSFQVNVCPLRYDIWPKKINSKTWYIILGHVYFSTDRLKQDGCFATLSTDYLLFCGCTKTTFFMWVTK